MTPKKIIFEDIFFDESIQDIFEITKDFKSASEISLECRIPIMTTYRRIKTLLNYGFLEIRGYIINGKRLNKYRRTLVFRYGDNNPRVKTIDSIVTENPGISYSDLKKMSGLANGTLSHCISKMINDKRLTVKRTTRRTWFFPHNVEENEINILINLRKETHKKILTMLLNRKKASFKEIKNEIKKSPGTTSLALTHLVELGILNRIPEVRPRYEIKNESLVFELLQKIEPNTLENMKDRFSDTFSYF